MTTRYPIIEIDTGYLMDALRLAWFAVSLRWTRVVPVPHPLLTGAGRALPEG